MECAVMKQSCLVIIVLWLIVNAAVGHMSTQHSKQPLQTKSNKAGSIGAGGCSNSTAVCPDGFEQLGWQKCYYFSCITETWDGALLACRSMGTTLAYPLNAAEDTTLSNYISSRFPGTPEWWIGGTDAANEGQWVWAHDNSPIVYTNWGLGEPSNESGQNYLRYWATDYWKWHDTPRTYLYPFVCQQL